MKRQHETQPKTTFRQNAMSQQFGARFTSSRIPAWSAEYVPYLQLKENIHRIARGRQLGGAAAATLAAETATQFRDALARAERFGQTVLAALTAKLEELEATRPGRVPAFAAGGTTPSNAAPAPAAVSFDEVKRQLFAHPSSDSGPIASAFDVASPAARQKHIGRTPPQAHSYSAAPVPMREFPSTPVDVMTSDGGGNSNGAANTQHLREFADVHLVAVKICSFLELNHLALTRVAMKFDQQCCSGGDGGGGEPAFSSSSSIHGAEQAMRNALQGSQLRTQRRKAEALVERTIATARSLFGAERVDDLFHIPASSAPDLEKRIMKKHWAAVKWWWVLIAALSLFVVLAVPIFLNNKAAHACAAMTVCIAVLWATEAVPFFATAMFIPLLAVPLGVLASTPPPAGATEFTHADAAKMLLGKMFGGTQILVLGGLVMGRALQKHKLELIVSRYLLAPLAHRPRIFVLALMIAAVPACAVLSNVAAPVLMLNVVQPILWRMDRSSGAPQAILLAMAFAANFGGMISPIASPQNAVALQSLAGATSRHVAAAAATQVPSGSDSTATTTRPTSIATITFTSWLLAAGPIVILGIVVSWYLIFFVIWVPFADGYVIPVDGTTDGTVGSPGAQQSTGAINDGDSEDADDDPTMPMRAVRIQQRDAPASTVVTVAGAQMSDEDKQREAEKWLVVVTSCITIVLWCVPLEGSFGDAGVVALLPIVVFFGVGVLSKEDFNNLSWHLLFLLAGGNMLGVCTKESGLLQDTIQSMKPFLTGSSEFAVVAVLILAVALITTFISHTVAALILMPVIVEIAGVNPSLPSAQALVFLTVIMCSGSMAFPISSFPNVNSLLAEDEHGHPYLEPKHYLLPGAALSLLSVVALISFMLPFAEFLFPK